VKLFRPSAVKQLLQTVAKQDLFGVTREGLPHVLKYDRGLPVKYAHRTLV
jgi:hypothetical protein